MMGSNMLVPQEEPTMEEILAAVRKIISEDNPQVAPAPAEAPTNREMTDESAEEIIFERTAPTSTNDIFFEHPPRAAQDIFDSLPYDVDPAFKRPQDGPVAGSDSSVEAAFERVVRESFEPLLRTHLADNSGPVIERMKPFVREWLEANFPALLENAIRGKVERIVSSRTRR